MPGHYTGTTPGASRNPSCACARVRARSGAWAFVWFLVLGYSPSIAAVHHEGRPQGVPHPRRSNRRFLRQRLPVSRGSAFLSARPADQGAGATGERPFYPARYILALCDAGAQRLWRCSHNAEYVRAGTGRRLAGRLLSSIPARRRGTIWSCGTSKSRNGSFRRSRYCAAPSGGRTSTGADYSARSNSRWRAPDFPAPRHCGRGAWCCRRDARRILVNKSIGTCGVCCLVPPAVRLPRSQCRWANAQVSIHLRPPESTYPIDSSTKNPRSLGPGIDAQIRSPDGVLPLARKHPLARPTRGFATSSLCLDTSRALAASRRSAIRR